MALIVPASFAASLARSAANAVQAPDALVNIQFLDVSDWHGQLDPLTNVGGASAISYYWKADRASNPNSITLTAGDDFGATPPLSGYFNEAPAVKAQRMMGVQVNTFGNHNFDRGVQHLQQMIELAGAPTAPLTPTSIYNDGVPFTYVAANLSGMTGVLTGVLPYQIFDMSGVKVAVIGLVNEEAPTLLFPGAMGPLTITDSAAAAMAARSQAASAGAQVFVAITHKGITSPGQGPLIDFATAVTGFDIIFGDHTDLQVNTTINGALVTENKSKGATYLKVNLTYDTTAGAVVSKTPQFITPNATPTTTDPAIVAMLQPYRDALSVAYDAPVATANGFFPRGSNIERFGETPVGNLTADALREAYGTDIAITNSGGLRDSLPSTYAPRDHNLRRGAATYPVGPSFDIVIGDIYALLPFGNVVVTRQVTGGQIWRMLEHGVEGLPGAQGFFPQVSGFKGTFDSSKPTGSQVISVTLDNGTQVFSNTTSMYTLATNDFMNAGGDGYTMLADGQGVTRDIMANVVLDYVTEASVITPMIEGRLRDITRISDIPDITVPVNTATGARAFTISDPRFVTDPTTTTVTLAATSSNTTLVPNANVTFSGTGTNRTVNVTPAAGQRGVATIAVRVTGTATAIDTFVVVVNDKPTLSAIGDATTGEDTPAVITFTVGDPDTRLADLAFGVSSSNTVLLPNANVMVAGSGLTRTLTLTPALNQSGMSTVAVSVTDGFSTASRTFTLTVNPVNDAPTLSPVNDVTMSEDTVAGPIAVTLSDVDGGAIALNDLAGGAISLTATSSNQTVLPNSGIALGGSGNNRTLTLTPAPDQSGVATVTLTASDGLDSSSRSFVVTVTPVNDAPQVNDIAPQSTNEDTPTGSIAVTFSDIDTALDSLTVNATSSDQTLLPNANIAISGTGGSRTLVLTPAADQTGTVTVTVNVVDGEQTVSRSFVLTVNPVNDAPTISAIADQMIPAGGTTGALAFTVADIDNAVGALTVSVSSSNTTLVPNANVTIGGSGANRTVTVVPAPGQTGTATITVTVSDGQTTATETFDVTVSSQLMHLPLLLR